MKLQLQDKTTTAENLMEKLNAVQQLTQTRLGADELHRVAAKNPDKRFSKPCSLKIT